MPTVLLVSDRREAADRLGQALERSAFDVLTCCGSGPEPNACIGLRSGRCPLPEAADVVILDGRPQNGRSPQPVFWELVRLYLELGRPVVALVRREDAAERAIDLDRVRILPPNVGWARLTRAVQDALPSPEMA